MATSEIERRPGTVTRLRTPLSPDEVLGVVWSVAGPIRVPARCWPMQVALENLALHLGRGVGQLAHAVASWPIQVSSSGRAYVGVDLILRELANAGHLIPEGRGWDGGFRPSSAWLERSSFVRTSLPSYERAAVDRAAQRLVATVTIWSKKALVSLDDRSATS